MTARSPDLRRLPPTDPALDLNIKRAHYQAMLWFHCINGEPPTEEIPLEVLDKYCYIFHVALVGGALRPVIPIKPS